MHAGNGDLRGGCGFGGLARDDAGLPEDRSSGPRVEWAVADVLEYAMMPQAPAGVGARALVVDGLQP